MPYRPGEQKRWWLSLADISDPHNSRLRAYVRALLTAENHHCDVPHFQTLSDYLRIVDPHELAVLEDRQRKARKRKSAHMQVLMDVDDWDILDPQAKPKAKRSRVKGPAPKRSRRKQPLAAIESEANPALALDDAANTAGDGGDVVDRALPASEVVENALDDGSHASDISSDELLQELQTVMKEGDVEQVGAEGAVGVDAAARDGRAASSSSGSSSSSSSSSSDSDSSSSGSSDDEKPAATSKAGRKGPKPKSKAKGKAKPAAMTAGTRDKSNRLEYGLHHLVPRFKESVLVGYQMTCCIAGHNTTAKCTREMSVNVAGSAEDCRRVLKAWVLLGHSMSSRDEHMDKATRDLLQEALKQHTLLSEAELDAILATSEESEIVAPFREPEPDKKRTTKKKTLLGGAGSVPKHIHEDMESLASSGGVPITTLAQRQRNKLTASTSYAVPSALQTALHHGYIGPNLPPPRGYYWAYSGGSWMLKIRGG